MAKPATHYGICQACFREQKAPEGLLAKHGYQVADRGAGGWFSGTCQGSDAKPFEVTCELTKELIVRATEQRDRLRENAEKHIDKATPDDVRISHQVGGYYGFTIWAVCTIVRVEGMTPVYTVHSDKKNEEHSVKWGAYGPDLEKAALQLNNKYSASLKYEAENLDRHIDHMKKKVANWKPRRQKKVV